MMSGPLETVFFFPGAKGCDKTVKVKVCTRLGTKAKEAHSDRFL